MSEIWKTRSTEVLLERPPWFEVIVEEVELPGGKIVSDYHQILMPHFTAVFAVTQNHNIMVIRCYRHAVGEVTLTMPGGMLEAEEDPIAGIKRELLEETGYIAHEWQSLGTFLGKTLLERQNAKLLFKVLYLPPPQYHPELPKYPHHCLHFLARILQSSVILCSRNLP